MSIINARMFVLESVTIWPIRFFKGKPLASPKNVTYIGNVSIKSNKKLNSIVASRPKII